MRQFKNLFLVVLLMAAIPCLADEPNTPVSADFNQLEDRFKALEDRIIDLENRIAELETRRPAPLPRGPNSVPSTKNDPVQDALRIERCKKAVQDANDLIMLNKTRLKNLPICYHVSLPESVLINRDVKGQVDANHVSLSERVVITSLYDYPHYYYPSLRGHFAALEYELNYVLDNIELLGEVEKSYKSIMRYAQLNPELGIDRMSLSKILIELTGEQKAFENERVDLQTRFRNTGRTFTRNRGYE